MATHLDLPKREYSKDKTPTVPVQHNSKKHADTNLSQDKKAKGTEKKKFFNTEDIFKAKKHELF